MTRDYRYQDTVYGCGSSSSLPEKRSFLPVGNPHLYRVSRYRPSSTNERDTFVRARYLVQILPFRQGLSPLCPCPRLPVSVLSIFFCFFYFLHFLDYILPQMSNHTYIPNHIHNLTITIYLSYKNHVNITRIHQESRCRRNEERAEKIDA
jgi:hypothetical protein